LYDLDNTIRVAKLRKWANAGVCPSEAARRLNISLSALSQWARRNAPETYKSLKHNAAPGFPDIPRDQAIVRLKLGAAIEAAGVSPHALAQWLFNNAPDGSANALADYQDD